MAVPTVILPRIHVGEETKWSYKSRDFKHIDFWIIIFEITYCAATCISAILGLMMITISFCWYYANPIENERKLAQRISFEPKFQATPQFIRTGFIKCCQEILFLKYFGKKILNQMSIFERSAAPSILTTISMQNSFHNIRKFCGHLFLLRIQNSFGNEALDCWIISKILISFYLV